MAFLRVDGETGTWSLLREGFHPIAYLFIKKSCKTLSSSASFSQAIILRLSLYLSAWKPEKN